MKFYLVTASDSTTDHQTWAASQSDAAGARKHFVSLGIKRKDISTYEVDVPTSRAELLVFLNDYQGSAQLLVGTRKIAGS